MTPVQAIREKCLDCSGGSVTDVRDCWSKECPLYEYRLGHNPARKGIGRKGGNPEFRKNSTSNSDTGIHA